MRTPSAVASITVARVDAREPGRRTSDANGAGHS
jgi:hypothetical protein